MKNILTVSYCLTALALITVSACKTQKSAAEAKRATASASPDAASAVTYTGHIKNIIDNACVSCHKLGTYEAVKATAAHKSFLGAINHEKGFSAMPKAECGSTKLDDAVIQKITSWVQNGMPE